MKNTIRIARWRTLIAVIPVVLLALGASSVSAAPASTPTEAGDLVVLPPAALHNPDVPLSTILALPDYIQQDGSIRIDPDLDPSLPIVSGDRIKAATVTPGIVAPLAGGTITIPALPGVWSGTYSGNYSVAGSVGFQLTYYFTTSYAPATAKATGWTSGGETWYSLGSVAGNTTTVPWGNVLATPKGQAMTSYYASTVTIHY